MADTDQMNDKTEEMGITEYLTQGGRLTNPANVPPRYRGELMKIMATFVDSELAAAAGFADVINAGPSIKARIAAARIVLEKTDNASKVLALMQEFGANTELYANHHPWTDRLPRDTAPGSNRSAHDMRLSVLNYPLDGWTDAVTMHFCMGLAVGVQIEELTAISYQPLADTMREILPIEAHHTELAEEGLSILVAEGKTADIKACLDYWRPRVAAVFGNVSDERMAQLRGWGLRRATGADMQAMWQSQLDAGLSLLGLVSG